LTNSLTCLLLQVPTASDVVGNFSCRNIDLNECLSAFGSITSNVVGDDGISVKFLKLLLPFICCHVMHVFNHAITSSVFLSMWKVAIVRPVAKVGTPSGPSNFRPISVVSVSLLSDFQFGFWRGHSTTIALVRVTEEIAYG
jgi:hypothetical protein